MKSPINTLVFIYNSFKDPLFQNLVLKYVKTLSKNVNGEFHIVTFEQPHYYISKDDRKKIQSELASSNIFWHPLDFHTGRFLLIKKAWDFIQAFFHVLALRIKYKTQVVFAFANVAASIAIILKRLLRMKMIIYSYEPHSEFMVELDLWSRRSLKFKILNYLEALAGHHADFIMTGTQYMVDRLNQEGSRAIVHRAPTAVDENDFFFRERGRKIVRKALNIQNRNVILYLGKFGGLYYSEEIPQMCAAIKKENSDAYFLVVTPNQIEEVDTMYNKFLANEDYHISGQLNYEDIKDYISAADLGISGVPPSKSQRYRSPTKVAEYLMCGTPYITTEGVSEDDLVAIKDKVGVVVKDFSQESVDEQMGMILELLTTREKIRDRCRKSGLVYRSKSRIDNLLLEYYRSL